MSDYQPQTATETVQLIVDGTDPWLAIGQFLDDWRRTELSSRPNLSAEAAPAVSGDHVRWAAFVAATVELLSVHDGLAVPEWTRRAEYRLPVPWFLYPGWRLRAWQLFETPVPFRMRNIFGGDRMLARA